MRDSWIGIYPICLAAVSAAAGCAASVSFALRSCGALSSFFDIFLLLSFLSLIFVCVRGALCAARLSARSSALRFRVRFCGYFHAVRLTRCAWSFQIVAEGA